MAYPGETVLINGNNLNNIPNFMVNVTDVEQVPKRALESYKLARTVGQVPVSSYWDYREIIIKCTFLASSKAAFEAARDTLLSYINGASVTLRTKVAGADRNFTVTLSDSTSIPEFYGGYAPIELHFNAYDPFGYDTNATTLTMSTFTTSGTQWTWTFGGSYDALPTFTFTLNSFTQTIANTAISVVLTNPATGVSITINRVWSASDVIVVNTQKRTITVNGVAVPWSGGLLAFDIGQGTLQWTDGFTARNVTATGNYKKRYL